MTAACAMRPHSRSVMLMRFSLAPTRNRHTDAQNSATDCQTNVLLTKDSI